MGLYAAEKIGQIPADDIAESHRKNYPTALVIVRRHLVERVYDVLKKRFPNAVLRGSKDLIVDASHVL
jgi:hypothetical protein